MRLGVHMPGSNLKEQILEADRLGMDCIQVFLGSPQRLWHVREHLDADKVEIANLIIDSGIVVAAHAPYVFNMGSEDDIRFKQAFGILKKFMVQCDSVGIQYAVTHVGSGSLQRVATVCKHVLEKPYRVKLCLENDAGSAAGTRLGSVVNIARLRKAMPDLRICVDTAHAYADGMDFTEKNMDLIIRMKPDLMHLNEPDENVICGKHLDRHNTQLSKGRKIGLKKLARLAQQLSYTPCIIEMEHAKAVASMREVRTSTLDMAPSSLIEEWREASEPAAAKVRGRRCWVCQQLGNSAHHVIPLKYWGPVIEDNMISVCINGGCNGHWLLNQLSDRWVKSHKQLFHTEPMHVLIQKCKDYISVEVRKRMVKEGEDESGAEVSTSEI